MEFLKSFLNHVKAALAVFNYSTHVVQQGWVWLPGIRSSTCQPLPILMLHTMGSYRFTRRQSPSRLVKFPTFVHSPTMSIRRIFLKKGKESSILRRHHWIF